MEELISKISEFPDSNLTLKNWCDENSIEQPKIIAYPLEKISKLYENFLDKYGSQQNFIVQHQISNGPIWFQNQLILFQWAVLALGFTQKIHLVDFKNSQIEFLSKIFRHKETYIIDYEIKCMLVKGKQIRNSWKIQQEQLLSSVINKIPEKNKWNQIARQLYKESEGKYFRQGKHCRERWVSYIENRKSDKEWSFQADIELLELISAMGKRWSLVANKFKKHQSRLKLRKRYQVLLSEASNQANRQLSQKQAISFMLKNRYQKFLNTNKNMNLREENIGNYQNNYSELARSFDEEQIQEQSIVKSNENRLSSKIQKQKCEEEDHQQLNLQMQKGGFSNSDQNGELKQQINFNTQISSYQNMYNVGYYPIQFYPQFYPIMDQNTLQSFNFYLYDQSLNLGEYFIFY